MTRLTISALLILLVLVTLGWLSCAGDPVETLVEASAPLCPKLANPCERVNCDRVDTRVLT